MQIPYNFESDYHLFIYTDDAQRQQSISIHISASLRIIVDSNLDTKIVSFRRISFEFTSLLLFELSMGGWWMLMFNSIYTFGSRYGWYAIRCHHPIEVVVQSQSNWNSNNFGFACSRICNQFCAENSFIAGISQTQRQWQPRAIHIQMMLSNRYRCRMQTKTFSCQKLCVESLIRYHWFVSLLSQNLDSWSICADENVEFRYVFFPSPHLGIRSVRRTPERLKVISTQN